MEILAAYQKQLAQLESKMERDRNIKKDRAHSNYPPRLVKTMDGLKLCMPIGGGGIEREFLGAQIQDVVPEQEKRRKVMLDSGEEERLQLGQETDGSVKQEESSNTEAREYPG